MKRLSSREQRLAATALVIGTVITGWGVVISPLMDGYVQRAEDRNALTDEYRRNDRILAKLPGWRMEAEEQAKTASSYAIGAPNEAIASELLSQRIARIVKVAGGTVQATQAVSQKTSPGWVHVRSDLLLTMGQIYAVMTRIQSEEPYVVVGYLSIEAQSNVNPNEPQNLGVRLDVFAPVRTSNTPPPARTSSRRS
ncbi:MAG TPA: type II secretion system protein GspM [Rhizomicrobium sp.]|jgi:hypothetical protein